MKGKILVGEPWDFTGPDGDNIIIGEILHIEQTFILLKTNNIYILNNIRSKVFILETRHEGSDFYNDKLVPVFGYIVRNYNQLEDVSNLLDISSYVVRGIFELIS